MERERIGLSKVLGSVVAVDCLLKRVDGRKSSAVQWSGKKVWWRTGRCVRRDHVGRGLRPSGVDLLVVDVSAVLGDVNVHALR